MGERSHNGPDIWGIVTAGLIIILIAVITILTPTIFTAIITFFTDIVWQEVYPGFYWWEPQSAHPIFYNTIFQFFIGILIINVVVLFLRILFKDTHQRQIETLGGIVLAAGVTWAAYNLTLNNLFTMFFGYFIVFAGLSLIISSIGRWVMYRRLT